MYQHSKTPAIKLISNIVLHLISIYYFVKMTFLFFILLIIFFVIRFIIYYIILFKQSYDCVLCGRTYGFGRSPFLYFPYLPCFISPESLAIRLLSKNLHLSPFFVDNSVDEILCARTRSPLKLLIIF